MSLVFGIGAGLVAALAQTASYFLSRRFMQQVPGGVLPLLATSHLLMGAASVGILLFFLPAVRGLSADCLGPLAGAAGFYLIGQAAMFWTIRRLESSRLAPLLGLKILVLALITSLFFHELLGVQRWLAVLGSVGAAFLLNEAGGRIPAAAVGGLLVTITGYCISDIQIVRLVQRLPAAGGFAPLLGVALDYLVCGIVAVPLFVLTRPVSLRVWRYAWPYAAAWFIGMVFLFICFAALGVVFGNIIQATRGVMSIVVGGLIAHHGFLHLESRIPRHVFWRRVAAALLMLAAIALYMTGA